MIFSPQTQKLYQFMLASDQAWTIKDLAKHLRVLPNALYRITDPLVEMGLLVKEGSHPVKLVAKPTSEAMGLFLLHQSTWFEHNVKKPTKSDKPSDSKPDNENSRIQLSFIQGRDKLMDLAVDEFVKVNYSVNLLRSGHEMPPELMRERLSAIKRGVKVRMLVQDYDQSNALGVHAWIRNGIIVRKTSMRELRLQVYDSDIVYFMSYKHSDSTLDMGMKVTYAPFAVMLNQLFEKWWDEAEEIGE